MAETVKKKDFVELKFTGYSNGEVFDSNIEEDLRKIDPEGKTKPQKTIVVIGEKMVVPGFDNALEGKEIGKEYEVDVKAKEGFGERRRELIKVIPLKVFIEKEVNPRPGMVFVLDQNVVKIIAVSGARVTTDFNNPLSGRDLKYKFTIVRKVEDVSEKTKAVFEVMFRFVPEFEVRGEKVFVMGPKGLEDFVKIFGERFKKLVDKDLEFELKEKKGELEEKVSGKSREEQKGI